MITLHPIAVAILFVNPSILLPNFESLSTFFFYGGSVALIAIYTAFGAVFTKKSCGLLALLPRYDVCSFVLWNGSR